MKIEHLASDKAESISWQRTWDEARNGNEWPPGAERLVEVFKESELVCVNVHQKLDSCLSLINAENLSSQQVKSEQRNGEGEDK